MGENDEMSKREENKLRDETWAEAGDLAATLAAIVHSIGGDGGKGPSGTAGGELSSNLATSGPIEIKLNGKGTGGLNGLADIVQSLQLAVNRGGGAMGWVSSINPLLGLLKLFGGRSRTEEIELPRYERPPRQSFTGGISDAGGWAARGIDYGAGWQMRTVEPDRPAAGAQITVNVQAMDSRSFLDHREEIAAAVRQALLESHSLSDVIGER